MQIKIVSDGTPCGTRVVNAETGENVKGVFSVEWAHTEPFALADATIKLYGVPIEAIAEVGEIFEITEHGDKVRRFMQCTPADGAV